MRHRLTIVTKKGYKIALPFQKKFVTLHRKRGTNTSATLKEIR